MELFDLKPNQHFLISQKAVIENKGKILVLWNTESKRGKTSRWELPGGLLYTNENLKAGLLREVKEETCLNIRIIKPLFVQVHSYNGFQLKDGRKINARIVGIAYLCKLSPGFQRLKLSWEHDRFKWATPKEIGKLDLAKNSKKLIEKYLKERNKLND